MGVQSSNEKTVVWETSKTILIRDTFILNMQDHDTQRELLKEIVSPTKALEVAIHMERWEQKQQKKSEL